MTPSLTANSWLACALTALAVLICRPALAQDGSPAAPTSGSGDQATAEALFEEGRKLMEEGRYDEACPKLAESQRLDPGGGTILNLALCHERQGKTATAWSQFKLALGTARKEGNEGRQKFAQQHIDALEPKLARLIVELDPGAAVAGLQIMRNETTLGSASFGVALPVDPGEQRIAATAPGYKPWKTAIVVQGEGVTERLVVPALTPDPVAQQPPASAPQPQPTPPDASDTGSTQATIGWIVGGAGVASVVVGAIFGGLAIAADGKADDACGDLEPCPNADGVDDSEDARSYATLANVFVFAGIGLTAVGVVLVLTAPSGEEPATTAAIAPAVGPAGAGASLRLTW